MSIFALTNLTIAILSLVLGLFTFLKNNKNPVNVNWSFTAFSVSLWSISFFAVVMSKSYEAANFWQYLLDFTSIWTAIFFFRFIFSLIGMRERFNVLYHSSIFVGLFVSFFSMTKYYRVGMTRVFTFEYWVNPGPLYFVSPMVYISFVVASLVLLFLGRSKARGSKRIQLNYVLLVAIIGFGGGSTNYFPQLFNAYPYGNYLVIFYIAVMTYAIVKHKLMDIRMVVARSVAYVILIATLAGIYAGSVLGLERLLFPSSANNFSVAEGAMRTGIAVIMVFLFQPIRTWINKTTDAIFFKNRYDSEELLNELSHTMSSTIILVEMLYKVNDILVRNLKLSRSAFVIFKNEHEVYTSQAIGYKGWPTIDEPDFLHMAGKGTLVYDELEEGSSYKRLLKKYDASIFIPVKLEMDLVGVYLAGEKNSGDMFNQQDMEVFDTMAPEVALAVQNAKSYEEISRFNVTLRQEIKRATKRLKDKNEQLKELDKAKDEFISMASHQLRTPLTAIKGYLSMLLEGDAGEIKVSQYDFINEAYSAAGRMVGLINDLLNVSRMETGRFFLEPKEVVIEKMVEEEVKQLQNHAREKGLYLKIEKKGNIPVIHADETKIRQVVMNFIDNAIYYTQKGGVTVKLRKEKDEFVFEVHDTGIGVPKEQARHLFEKFFRADNARQTRPDGTGLGIYLAKRVVEDHGGRIMFDSVEGKGSVFGFRFPLKKVTKTEIDEEPKKTAPALTSAAATFNEKTVGLEAPIQNKEKELETLKS